MVKRIKQIALALGIVFGLALLCLLVMERVFGIGVIFRR